jgi:sugar O-acyltransferase (sialic acid O-acetyltransferase NeuD family)
MSVSSESLPTLDKPVLLLGATDYAAVFLDMFEAVPGFELTGCVQNLDPADVEREILGRPVLWSGSIEHLRPTHDLICILGTTKRAAWIDVMAELGFGFATLVHPSSMVSARSTLGSGVSVDANTVIAGFSRIADHARIGRQVSIGHHVDIGRYCTIHPGTVVSGHCRIGEKVILGAGSVIIDGIEIGDGAFIAAGSVVTKKVPPRALVAGNPGRIVRSDYGPK